MRTSTAHATADWRSAAALALACVVMSVVFAAREQLTPVVVFAFGAGSLPAGVGAALRRQTATNPWLLRRPWLRVRPREPDGRSSSGWMWQAFIACWCFGFLVVAATRGLVFVVAVLVAVLAASSCLAGYLAFARFAERGDDTSVERS